MVGFWKPAALGDSYLQSLKSVWHLLAGSSQNLIKASEPQSLQSPSEGSVKLLTGTAELSQTLPAVEAKQTLLNGHLPRSRDSLHELSH